MRVKEIKEKSDWEDFLLGCEKKTFLNSWNWGEFQKMMGNKIWRLGIYEMSNVPEGIPLSAGSYGAGKCPAPNGRGSPDFVGRQISNLIGVALVIKITARRGTFLFVPHGPIKIQNAKIKNQNDNLKLKILETLLKELKKIAKEEKVDFIRIAPIWERNEKNIRVFKTLGFREAPIHMHPELTWELDITTSEEDLLKNMRKTTRYLVRHAQKNKDIKLKKSLELKDIEKFQGLEQATVNRRHFTPFSLEYLKNEFLAFSSNEQIVLSLGKYRDEVVAGGIFVFWQGIGFYHHGASSLKYPKAPVSYLILWEAIKEAKNRGCKKFNFWGIIPVFAEVKTGNSKSEILNSKQIPNPKLQIPNKKHPWYGLTLFKIGFGGYKKEYVKTQDLPISKKYWLNYIIETVRKNKRGL